MKIYKIAFRNPIDLIANSLSTKIFQYIIDLHSKNKLSNNEVTFLEAPNSVVGLSQKPSDKQGLSKTIELVLNLQIIDRNITPPIRMKGGFILPSSKTVPNNHIIQLYVIIGSGFSKNSFGILYWNIVKNIRHELEHARQYEMKLLKSNKDYSNIDTLETRPIEIFKQRVAYISNPLEQKSFIRAIMMLCKKTKRPIIDAINEFIDIQLYGDSENKKYIKKIMGNEANDIENKIKTFYQSKTREIYPKTKDNNATTNNTARTKNI